jgi:branched-chain amino acid transport system permease protein
MKVDSEKSILLGIIVLSCFAPLFIRTEYHFSLIILAGINIIFVTGLNIVTGVTGLFSFCHPSFLGIGAYTSALLMMKLGLPFWLTLPSAALLAAAFGAFLGLTTLRLRGHYLAISTMFFGTILYQIMMNWVSLTRGAAALMGIPSPGRYEFFGLFSVDFANRITYYYLVLFCTVVMVWLAQKVLSSRVGDAFLALRGDEVSARVLGIDTFKYKVLAFTMSAFYGGVAGALYAHYEGLIAPHMFAVHESVTPYVMMIIGGLGNIYGGVAGSVIMTVAPEYLRAIAQYRMVTYGALIVVLVILMPEGIGAAAVRIARVVREMFSGREKLVENP